MEDNFNDDAASDIEVNVSSQGLSELPPLAVSVYPTTLVCSFNRLSSLDVGSFGDLLSGLLRLDLSHNTLAGELPPLGAAAPNLQILNISFNRITTMSVVAGCYQLREVWANDNSLAQPLAAAVHPLAQLPRLTLLALHNNPCMNTGLPAPPETDASASVRGANDPRVLYIVNACSSLQQLTISAPRAPPVSTAARSLADGGDGSCATIPDLASVIVVTRALEQAAYAWHSSFTLSTPPLRHLLSGHSLVRSGSTRSLLGLPPAQVHYQQQHPLLPRTKSAIPSARSHSRGIYSRGADNLISRASARGSAGGGALGPDAGPDAPLKPTGSFRYPYFGPPPGQEHVPPYNLVVDVGAEMLLRGSSPAPAPLSAGTVARLARKLTRGESLSSFTVPVTARGAAPPSARNAFLPRAASALATEGAGGARSPARLPLLAHPSQQGLPPLHGASELTTRIAPSSAASVDLSIPDSGDERPPSLSPDSGGGLRAALLPPLSASPVRAQPLPPPTPALQQHEQGRWPAPEERPRRSSTEAPPADPLDASPGTHEPELRKRPHRLSSLVGVQSLAPQSAALDASLESPGALAESGHSVSSAPQNAGIGGAEGFSVTFSGEVQRPPADWSPDVALRVEGDGTASGRWPGDRAALSVMVDDKATDALRRYAVVAGLSTDEIAAIAAQSAYGVVAYPRETAPSADAAVDDVVDRACVAVDGFGVGFISSVDGPGVTLVHLAEDGSGFHADESGVVQRRWGRQGELSLVAPTFACSDIEVLERLGAAAGSSVGEGAVGEPESNTSPRGVSGHQADRSELRRSLLRHLFPGADIPPLAAEAPVTYLSSTSGVAFLLGSNLAAYVDMADRYVKLFLACRSFRYELVVAPVVAGLATLDNMTAE